MNYTKAYTRLQEIIASLEQNKVAIDDLPGILKEAKTLVATCKKNLASISDELENASSESVSDENA